jgi:uncharacterized integral membrane protein
MDEGASQGSGPERRVRRRRRSGRRTKLSVPRFFREWWVELLVALLIVVVVFLLVERMSIRQSLLAGASGFLAGLGELLSTVVGSIADFVRGTPLSNLTAYVLLLGVIGLAAWRLRWRLMTSPRLTVQACPRCGGELHRIRRRSRDRLVDRFVPVRRYQCRNKECRWRGLRVHRSRHE